MGRGMIDADLLYRTIRERIKRIRTAETDTKLSQEELGLILGLKRSSVANLETGAQRVSIQNIYALCDHFGLDLLDILPDIETVRAESEGMHAETNYEVDTKLIPIIKKLQGG